MCDGGYTDYTCPRCVPEITRRAYAAGVQAARDAVAAEHESARVDYSAGYLLGMKDALAAIDALREVSE